MATQNKTKLTVECECDYKTPPPECCNGSVNIYGYYEPPRIENTEEKQKTSVGLANLTGYFDY